eukprot:366360-Chlamydomonas_euryale.AAC.21
MDATHCGCVAAYPTSPCQPTSRRLRLRDDPAPAIPPPQSARCCEATQRPQSRRLDQLGAAKQPAPTILPPQSARCCEAIQRPQSSHLNLLGAARRPSDHDPAPSSDWLCRLGEPIEPPSQHLRLSSRCLSCEVHVNFTLILSCQARLWPSCCARGSEGLQARLTIGVIQHDAASPQFRPPYTNTINSARQSCPFPQPTHLLSTALPPLLLAPLPTRCVPEVVSIAAMLSTEHVFTMGKGPADGSRPGRGAGGGAAGGSGQATPGPSNALCALLTHGESLTVLAQRSCCAFRAAVGQRLYSGWEWLHWPKAVTAAAELCRAPWQSVGHAHMLCASRSQRRAMDFTACPASRHVQLHSMSSFTACQASKLDILTMSGAHCPGVAETPKWWLSTQRGTYDS